MYGMMGARLVGNADESTELQRRHSVWLFPGVILLHLLPVRALAPDWQSANLLAALVAIPVGLGFRWVRRATLVIAAMIAFSTFTFLYLFGVAFPLVYLVVVRHSDLIPLVGLFCIAVLALLVAQRVTASLKREWRKPLEETEGVHIATQDWILRREPSKELHGLFNLIASLLGLAMIPALAVTRGRPEFLLLILAIIPFGIALMCADGVARWVAFLVVVRRWEAAHHIRLRFPVLRRRSTPRAEPVSNDRKDSSRASRRHRQGPKR